MSDINALYMRVCEMNIAGRLLSAPPMTLEFEYEFSTAGLSNIKARVMNPAPATVAAARKGATCTISAGYLGDSGSVFTGVIDKPGYMPGKDSSLTLTLRDDSERYATSVMNFSIKGPVSASQVANELLNKVGITRAKLNLGDDVRYERGFSCQGMTLRTALSQIARDTKSQLFFRNGQCCLLAPEKGVSSAWELSSSTGLLNAAQTDSGYKIKTLFLYRLGAGSLVILKRKDSSVTLRISKGKHTFSPKGTTETEFEAGRI